MAGAITVGRAGERLAPMAELAALGVRLFTDDGCGVQSAGLMRRALEYAARASGVTLAQHCEDAALAGGGAMHEGAWSSRLGMPGIPAAAEEVMVARDIALARPTGARIHFLHLSTATVRRSRRGGPRPRACRSPPRSAPHHFALTDGALAGYDPVFKVNPPLRPEADVAAVQGGPGRRDGRCHRHRPRPHAPEPKDLPFDQAAAGHARPGDGPVPGPRPSSGLPPSARSSPSSAGSRPPSPGWTPPSGGDQGGPIEPGAAANLCVIDPDGDVDGRPGRPGQPEPEHPLCRPTLTGRVRHTVFRGSRWSIDGEAPAMSGRTRAGDRAEALLVLADGTVFEGEASVPPPDGGVATGEAVFNTVLSGYQEVITDPSYAGQVIAFTYPHIGNYGVNPTDNEAGPAVLPGRDRPRPGRPPEQLAVGRGASTTS